jgi:hypothetical protein
VKSQQRSREQRTCFYEETSGQRVQISGCSVPHGKHGTSSPNGTSAAALPTARPRRPRQGQAAWHGLPPAGGPRYVGLHGNREAGGTASPNLPGRGSYPVSASLVFPFCTASGCHSPANKEEGSTRKRASLVLGSTGPPCRSSARTKVMLGYPIPPADARFVLLAVSTTYVRVNDFTAISGFSPIIFESSPVTTTSSPTSLERSLPVRMYF